MSFYRKTEQFRNVIRSVAHTHRYMGEDENGNPIYSNEVLPQLTFTGTVKLHGTNAAIEFTNKEGIKYMSRNRYVKVGHYDFPDIMRQEAAAVELLIRDCLDEIDGLDDDEKLHIYGEWAGPGIQNGVGISKIPEKCWFIFAVKYTDAEGVGHWLEDISFLRPTSSRIKNIHMFPTWSLDIDFESPQMSQNTLIEITKGVEDNCPVSEMLGVSGIGEGVVWSTHYKGKRFIFKCKGEKHTGGKSKVKTMAEVDPIKLASIQSFVDYAVTPGRVNQAMESIETEELTRKHTGDILRWIANDIIEEELDVLAESNLTWKQVASKCSERARRMFFHKLDTINE